MTPAGAKFDRRLTEIIAELRGDLPDEEQPMPEAGGKKLAGDFAGLMADVRKSIDEAKQIVTDAAKELQAEVVTGAQDAANALRAEAADVRKGFSELLGNNPPESTS